MIIRTWPQQLQFTIMVQNGIAKVLFLKPMLYDLCHDEMHGDITYYMVRNSLQMNNACYDRWDSGNIRMQYDRLSTAGELELDQSLRG